MSELKKRNNSPVRSEGLKCKKNIRLSLSREVGEGLKEDKLKYKLWEEIEDDKIGI